MRERRTEPATATTRRARTTSTLLRSMLVSAILSPTFLACSSLLAGPDECGQGESQCDGNDVLICEPPCSEFGCTWHWDRRPCSGPCVNPAGSPFCARSSAPDPKCAGRVGYCDGNTAVACRDGFSVDDRTCGASQVCALDGTDSLCALSKEPDPRCAGREDSVVCDGNDLVTCSAGFAVSAQVCPVACVSTFCALSSEPDPKCAGNNAAGRYCDGDVLVICSSGFDFERVDCSAPSPGSPAGSCWQFAEGATCGGRRDGG